MSLKHILGHYKECGGRNARLVEIHVSVFILVINQLDIQNFCFTVSFISCLYMFRAYVLIIRRSKLHYTTSGIIKPIGGGLVDLSQCLTNLMHKNLFYNKFYFMALHVSSTCAHHHAYAHHHIYRCDGSSSHLQM